MNPVRTYLTCSRRERERETVDVIDLRTLCDSYSLWVRKWERERELEKERDEIMWHNMNRERERSCIFEMAEDRRSTQPKTLTVVSAWILLVTWFNRKHCLGFFFLNYLGKHSHSTCAANFSYSRHSVFSLSLLFLYVWKFRIVFFQKLSQIHWWTLCSSFPRYVTKMM